jgi:hypothetical protein
MSLISVVIDMLENLNPQDSHLELQVEDAMIGAHDFLDDWGDDRQAEMDLEPEDDVSSDSETGSGQVELDNNAATMISHFHSSGIGEKQLSWTSAGNNRECSGCGGKSGEDEEEEEDNHDTDSSK